MTMIEEYNEDSVYNATNSFIKSKGFKEYFNRQVENIRKHDSGHKITEDEFNLKNMKFTFIDNIAIAIIVFNVKPSYDTVQEILDDRWYEGEGEAEVKETFKVWADKLSENIQEILWAAVYNYQVLNNVNDNVPLGDVVDFEIKVKSITDVDFENNVYNKF